MQLYRDRDIFKDAIIKLLSKHMNALGCFIFFFAYPGCNLEAGSPKVTDIKGYVLK